MFCYFGVGKDCINIMDNDYDYLATEAYQFNQAMPKNMDKSAKGY